MYDIKKAREEFNALPSYGDGPVCPDCGTRATMPYPNCGCPNRQHIMEWHHACSVPWWKLRDSVLER